MADDTDATKRIAQALVNQAPPSVWPSGPSVWPSAPSGNVPLPQPDPRGPPVQIGAPNSPMPPAAPALSGHILAALRAMFEGDKYREKMAPGRDASGLYDVPRQQGQ